jgi:hypothetical protein
MTRWTLRAWPCEKAAPLSFSALPETCCRAGSSARRPADQQTPRGDATGLGLQMHITGEGPATTLFVLLPGSTGHSSQPRDIASARRGAPPTRPIQGLPESQGPCQAWPRD